MDFNQEESSAIPKSVILIPLFYKRYTKRRTYMVPNFYHMTKWVSSSFLRRHEFLPRKRNLQEVKKGSPLAEDNALRAWKAKIFKFMQESNNFGWLHPIFLNIDLEATLGWGCYKILLTNDLPVEGNNIQKLHNWKIHIKMT